MKGENHSSLKISTQKNASNNRKTNKTVNTCTENQEKNIIYDSPLQQFNRKC